MHSSSIKLQEELIKKCSYLPPSEVALIQSAIVFASDKHASQLRLSKEPYLNHPLSTAITLAEIKLDHESIIAAVLHDALEDTDTTAEEIKTKFGNSVFRLVDGVTKVSHVRLPKTAMVEKTYEEHKQLESLRKLFLAMAKDLRVVLIKLADRLHNMQTLQFVPEHKQSRIASETLEIYVPLANRLGIWPIKSALEDLCFKYLFPQDYIQCFQDVNKKTSRGKKYIDKLIPAIAKNLRKNKINHFTISGRMKNLYSIYLKTTRQNKTVDEIYDIYAVRIVAESLPDCYTILGLVHNMATPIPGRFKDYISVPKPNGYQSLHTSVFTPDGQKVEIQIRTQEMHEHAEFGVAAHWLYKEKKSASEFNWVKELTRLKDANVQELSEELKINLFKDRIFIYTPKGDVKDLPIGSTPIDFAYNVHSQIGDKLIGAKVNNKIVSLDYQLQNGDIVEVLTSKTTTGPKRQWLDMAFTNFAKSKIKAFLKKANSAENLKNGRSIIDLELKKINLPVFADTDKIKLKKLLDALPYQKPEDILIAVSQGDLSPRRVIKILYPDSEIFTKSKNRVKTDVKPKFTASIVFGNDQQLSHKISTNCCHPKFPNPIIGYITRGQGITVHDLTCPSLVSKEPDRLIVAKWRQTKPQKYYVDLELDCEDRVGMLHDITKVISDAKINLTNIAVRFNKNHSYAIIKITVNIASLDHLANLINHLTELSGVKKVVRL